MYKYKRMWATGALRTDIGRNLGDWGHLEALLSRYVSHGDRDSQVRAVTATLS